MKNQETRERTEPMMTNRQETVAVLVTMLFFAALAVVGAIKLGL